MRMKRGAGVTAVLLCAAMAAVSFFGCGSGGAVLVENPLDLFKQAQENMQTVASYRIAGEMLMDTSFEGETMSMTMEYDMVCEQKSGGEFLARMDICMEGPPSFETVAYLTGDRMYMEMPGVGWVYQDYDLSSELADMDQMMGPRYVTELLEMAESAEVVAEDGDTITYDLVLDFDRLMQEQGELMDEQMAELGLQEEDLSLYMDFIREAFENMELLLTVDKGSGLATRLQIHMEIDLSSIAEMMGEEALPGDMDMTMDADFRISDYGKSFDIRLPEEAEDATPMEDITGSLRT